jgi:hypothetical protein
MSCFAWPVVRLARIGQVGRDLLVLREVANRGLVSDGAGARVAAFFVLPIDQQLTRGDAASSASRYL